jgi:hypothetical protein
MQLYLNSNHQNTPWDPLECTLYYLKWPHQPFVARIIRMEFVANFNNISMNGNPYLLTISCYFIIKKGNGLRIFN